LVPAPNCVGNRKRRYKLASVAATVCLAATLLAGCSKPTVTDVTVFSGTKGTTVRAQPLCVLVSQCEPHPDLVADMSVPPASTLLIDVPSGLAKAGWIATAYTTDAKGTNTPVEGASAPPTNTRAVQVQVPNSDGGYFLRVTSLRPSKKYTTWLVRVRLAA
jgi:hypothetical protein